MEKFYLGLDIGTDSVGIACTDGNYNLLRKRKDLWAVRLFDESKDASKRRAFRTSRRRKDRRKERIALLQGIFAPYITDMQFFLRLKNSSLLEVDKPDGLPEFCLFDDENYTDKQFHKEYPTIFHLRQKLSECGSDDLRLYYLALHHIIKYRGHFLFEGSGETGGDIRSLFSQFNSVSAYLTDGIVLDENRAEEFLAIALDSTKHLTDKKRELCAIFGTSPEMKEIITFLVGGKGKPDVLSDCGGEKSFSFDISDEEFEAKADSLGDMFELFDKLRNIFKFVRLEKILDGSQSVSGAMIRIYDKHADDLKLLKRLILNFYSHDLYCKVFKSTGEKSNYVNYIGYTKNHKKINVTKCKYDDFCKYILKEISSPPENEEGLELWERITGELKSGSFLPKIINADNGLFPHQLNLAELDKILANLCRDFPEFCKKDTDGLTPCEKIRSIFTFRIPYFVGPLNPHSKNSWIVRREGKITAWNFKDMVDLEKSNEEFIRRMTGKCSYLLSEDVLPKCSVYYQAFDVLNQLNKLRINGEPVSIELKKNLFDNLFLTEIRVTDKKIREFLISHGYVSKGDSILITGKDGEFKANMRSYITLKSKLGSFVDEHIDICEDIILWHTLCTDKNMTEAYLLKRYGGYSEIRDNIKWIKGLSFKDFGRLSYKFLLGISGGEDPVGAKYTILSELYNTNLNLNEILFGEKYCFRQAIEAENGGKNDEVTYEDVKDLYVAPQLRRGIWQSLIMVDEYCKVLDRAPDKIFVEVTRSNNPADKKRTVSRKDRLLSLYDTIDGIEQLKEELKEKSDGDLRSDRLYLYFLQLGKCMYSGQQIDLLKLGSDTYDIDHIIPQSLVKDDSIDNRVLVLRSKNSEKSDKYPLTDSFMQLPLWKLLREKHMISDEKWARLTRVNPLTNEDYEGFVNRQLVYTNQMAKAVATLLQRKYGPVGTKIVYSKAANVSEFRKKFDIPKCRDTNDLHHARDAYLNIVVGNVYDVRFTSLMDYFKKRSDGSQRQINLDKLFTYDVSGAWDSKSSLGIVLSTVARNSMTVTRYSFIEGGGFYDQNASGKDEGNIGAPIKGKGVLADTSKYGGYKSLATAYFTIVQSKDKKGNIIKTIEAIPVLVDYKAHGDEQKILNYLETKCGLCQPQLIVPRLRKKSLVKVNGFPVYIAGSGGLSDGRISVHNAVQWFTDAATDKYVKALSKLLDRAKTEQISDTEEQYVMHTNRFGDKFSIIDREHNIALYEKMQTQISKKVYDGISGARNVRESLAKKYDKFKSLSVFVQVKVLMQIAKFLKCNAEEADLSLIGESSRCSLRISKTITNTQFTVVHTSPCGLDIKERDI